MTKTTTTKVTMQVIIRSFMSEPDNSAYGIPETIARIMNLTKDLTVFWSVSHGWATVEAAELLTPVTIGLAAFLNQAVIAFP